MRWRLARGHPAPYVGKGASCPLTREGGRVSHPAKQTGGHLARRYAYFFVTVASPVGLMTAGMAGLGAGVEVATGLAAAMRAL